MKYFPALLLGSTLAAALGCGGKVLVDGLPDSGGGQGGGGMSSSGSGGECKPMPAMGNAVITVCAAGPSGGCSQDLIADKVSMLQQACPDDLLCACRFDFVSAPCPPDSACCYLVEVTPMVVGCQ